MRLASYIFVCLPFIALSSLPKIKAQTAALAPAPSIDLSATAPVFGVGHDYISLFNETVDPASGSLSLRIPIQTPPDRLMQIPVSLSYDSGTVTSLALSTPNSPVISVVADRDSIGSSTGGWNYTYPHLTVAPILNVSTTEDGEFISSCSYDTDFTLTDLSGAKHSFPLLLIEDTQGPNGEAPCFTFSSDHAGQVNLSQVTIANDSQYQAVSNDVNDVHFADKDGNSYHFSINYAYGTDSSSVPPAYFFHQL